MANPIVGFKKGLAANLPTSGIQEGVFYLTTDTDRLYVGQNKGTVSSPDIKLVELNKSITMVNSIENLPLTGVDVGQFYYLKTGNILAVYLGSGVQGTTNGWLQINPDTNSDHDTYANGLTIAKNTTQSSTDKLVYNITLTQQTHDRVQGTSSNASSVVGTLTINSSDIAAITVHVDVGVQATVTNGVASVVTTGDGASGNGFSIEGTNVDISSTTGGIKLTGSKYSLSSAAGSTAIKLTGSGSVSTNETVTFEGDSEIGVSGATAGKINLTHTAHTVADSTAANAAATSIDHNGTFKILKSVATNATGHVTGYATETIKLPAEQVITATAISALANGNLRFTLNKNGTPTSYDSVGVTKDGTTYNGILYNTITVDGTASTVYNQGNLGSFYSASYIDSMINGLNAMTYKGKVDKDLASNDETASNKKNLPTSGVKVGDTWVVGKTGNYGPSSNIACSAGDMLIATGTEENGVITSGLTWVKVEAGSRDTTYTFSNTGTTLKVTDSTSGTNKTLLTINGASDGIVTATGSGSTITLGHKLRASGASADATAGTNSGTSVEYGGTFVVPKIVYDKYGHVISHTDQSISIPARSVYTMTVAENKITLTDVFAGGTNTSATFAAGSGLSVATDAALKTITYTHAAPGAATSTITPANSTTKTLEYAGEFIVPQVGIDALGHVATLAAYTIKLPKCQTYTFTSSGASAISGNSKASQVLVTYTATGKDGSDTVAHSLKTGFTSDSLTITQSTSNNTTIVNMDLEWGTF